MMVMGAFGGFIGTYFTGNIFVGLALAISGPALMAVLMAFLSVSVRTNQLVAGLAIWLLGIGLTSLLYRLTFGVVTTAPKVEELNQTYIPVLSNFPVFGPIFFQYDPLVYLGLLLVPLTQILIFKTNLGLKIRTVGENPRQADALGVSVPKIRYLAVIIGGALAGIGGSYLVLVTTGSFLDNITAGQGWIALAIVIFGRWKPFWILMGAWLFGMVDALQLGLQVIGTAIPAEFLLMLPYVLPICIMAAMYKRSAVPVALAMPYRRSQR